jgi:predicted DNA-binding transcriptional regulator AlpA
MEELFYETDNEIELYHEDAMDQDLENTDIDPETMDRWYETCEQRIYDTYTKEYEGYEEGCTYFFGCSLNSYKHNYEKRKKTFLEGFQDYDVYDFLRHEFDQGVFVYNRSYMEPKMMNKIEASLRKRFYFLREQAEMHGYEVSVLDDSSVRLAIKAEQKGGKEQNDLNEDNDGPSTTVVTQAAVTQSYHSDQFLSRNEVAKLLKISISTVHNWTKRGILTPYHIGGRVYFKPSEIENSMFKINYCGYERF